MTGIESLIMAIITVVAWHVGMRMQKSISNEELKYKENSIKRLKDQVEYYEKWTDTLFNEDDMNYNECVSRTFKKWLKEKYKEPPEETVKEWAAKYHQAVKDGILKY